jgi:8-amino-7-oxononanoate synthase
MNFLAHYQGAYDAFKKKRQQEHHWRTMDRDDGGVDHDHSLCQDPLTHWNKKKEGLSRKEGRRRYDFSHNDYLGLSSHPYVLKRAMDVAGKFGCGSRASRLLRDNGLYDPLEQLLCKAKGMEKALVFPSGYQANVAVLSTLLSQRILNKRCHVFVDALIHRSLIDGILLSKSNLQRFYHQDLDHLESMLEKNDDPDAFLAIVVESIYSMDGDRAPLSQYSELAKKYHAMLIVDDAHSMGLFGEAGTGWHCGDDRNLK